MNFFSEILRKLQRSCKWVLALSAVKNECRGRSILNNAKFISTLMAVVLIKVNFL